MASQARKLYGRGKDGHFGEEAALANALAARHDLQGQGRGIVSTDGVEQGEQGRAEVRAVAALVKARSLERYWSTLFASEDKQPALMALYAFNAELDHIAASVREPMVAQIRLQWWRDAIELAEPGMKTGNPVADALSGVILTLDLPRERLIGMIDARTAEIAGGAPATMEALRALLGEAQGPVFELASGILGVSSEAAKVAAQHAGFAWGLTQRLRTFPVQASGKRLQLPQGYLESRGVDLAWIYAGRLSAGLLAALGDFRAEAERSVQRVRDLAPEIGGAWPAFLPLAAIPAYLSAMAASSYDPLQHMAALNPLRLYWRIWRSARRHTV
jgi:15-cis-phytoene synthase